ncbi:MAG: exosortase N [Rufibacter sp.]
MQWYLGVALLPLVTLPSSSRNTSPFLAGLALLFLTLAGLYNITTMYFLGFLVAGWCALQGLAGVGGIYPVLLLGIVSPIFSYLTNIWSFPLRLQLTKMAVYLLGFLHPNVSVAGNLIVLNRQEFSVDPACAGLSMLSFSMMLAVFLLAHRHRVSKKPWPLPTLALLLFLMLILNVTSNLLRILLLVLFKVGPQNWMHDLLGLLCLLVYALIPFYFLLRSWGKKLPVAPSAPALPTANAFQFQKALRLNVLLLVCLVLAGFRIGGEKKLQAAHTIQAQGFRQEKLQDGILKLTNSQGLIYLKPVQGFYSAEHHPMVCWQGSGYQFQHVRETTVAGKQIFTGILQKQKDHLFTAWWMDNGHHQTIAQSDWRWRMFKGEPPFQLVNVTASSEAALQHLVTELLKNQKGAVVLSAK